MLDGNQSWLQPVQRHHSEASGHAAEVIGCSHARHMPAYG